MTVLATYLASNPWPTIKRTHDLKWGAEYKRVITLYDDASPRAVFDLSNCTFKLYVYKADSERTALVNGTTLSTGSGTVDYVVTAAQAATFPKGKKVIWRVTCESSASPLAFDTQLITWGESLVIGA